MDGPMNLVKFVASSGAASRREAERLIRLGHVSVNGAAATDPARRVTETDEVRMDGKKLSPEIPRRAFLLNKPRGYTCSMSDRHAEKLAVSLLAGIPEKVVSAGRLDRESEGAIIFSNDGDLINRLTHPRYGVLKTYIVRTAAPLSPADLRRMTRGIPDGGEILRAEAVRSLGGSDYEFILNEGRKREIRRLTAACGAPTEKLVRVRIGTVSLGDLPPGAFRELTPEEIAALKGGEA